MQELLIRDLSNESLSGRVLKIEEDLRFVDEAMRSALARKNCLAQMFGLGNFVSFVDFIWNCLHQPLMESSRRRSWAFFQPVILFLVLTFALPTQSLYFYLDGASSSPKCFYEELPKDTLVVGKQLSLRSY